MCRKGGRKGGEEEEEEEEVAAGSWRNQSPNNTIMIRGLPSGVTEGEVRAGTMIRPFSYNTVRYQLKNVCLVAGVSCICNGSGSTFA